MTDVTKHRTGRNDRTGPKYRSWVLEKGVTKYRTAPPRAPRQNTCLGFNWISRNVEEMLRKRWIRPTGQTYEGAKRPVTRRSRLLVVRCVRCTRCARCAVSSHRLEKCVWCGAYYWFRLRKATGYGFRAFLTCILLLLLLIQCKISLYLGPVRTVRYFVTPLNDLDLRFCPQLLRRVKRYTLLHSLLGVLHTQNVRLRWF